jgi:NADH dehydrogenase [ubiquinone] 1 alpha subcomplex assembly factor 7
LTPLETIIGEIIAAEGPMSIARYMALCLGHPAYGYYMSRDPFGAKGDFITAPEVSQMFGEIVGVWLASVYEAMGKPKSFHLVELGPGRGTLMADLLKAAKVMTGFVDAAKVHLVETSPTLRKRQRWKLGEGASWHDDLAAVPDGPMLLIANEFFDALPIHQYEKRDGKWGERAIGRDGPGLMPSTFMSGGRNGDVVEISPSRLAVGRQIGERLSRHPGAALIIDYGHLKSASGDTLQALHRHAKVAITHLPGESDITSHVDFEGLGRAMAKAGAKIYPPLTQRDFLLTMGLEIRASVLAAKADGPARIVLERAVGRLVDQNKMGQLFKVLAATSPGLTAPYPFGDA